MGDELLDPTVSSDVGSEIFIVLVAKAISADNLCIKRERKGMEFENNNFDYHINSHRLTSSQEMFFQGKIKTYVPRAEFTEVCEPFESGGKTPRDWTGSPIK